MEEYLGAFLHECDNATVVMHCEVTCQSGRLANQKELLSSAELYFTDPDAHWCPSTCPHPDLSGSGLSNQVVLFRTADGPYMNYVVQEGDSIHSIAKEFGISTKELAILNQIFIMETAKSHGLEFDDVTEYVKYLYPGEELLVPSSK